MLLLHFEGVVPKMATFVNKLAKGRFDQKVLWRKGAFKYYIIKEVGGWVGQMMMFDDKVGGWEWLNDDVIKK